MNASEKAKYKYFVGTKEQFKLLAENNKILDSYIIFISDTNEVYKGTEKFGSDNFIILTEEPSEPIEEKLYCINGMLMIYIKDEGWKILSKPYTMDMGESPDDETIPTSKAVKDFIDKTIDKFTYADKDDVITSIISTKEGTITITKGLEEKDISILGSVVNPSFDSEKKVLTLPYMGENGLKYLKIAFSQDVYINNGIYDEEAKVLKLNRTDNSSVDIDLQNIIVKLDPIETSSISIETNGNSISANVKVSEDSKNIVEIKDDGLFVPKSEIIEF